MKPKHDNPLSNVAFNFNLRHYTTGVEYCKRYYTLKKGILKKTQGLETFAWADRNAAIDIGTAAENYSWTEAVDIVREGYDKFSPKMAGLFMEMVEQKRIDVPAANGGAVQLDPGFSPLTPRLVSKS